MTRKKIEDLTIHNRISSYNPKTEQGLITNKALNPRQPPCVFYSEFWGLVRSEVMAMLEEFQHGKGNMTKINRSHLFLLLKSQGVNGVEDFRPISTKTGREAGIPTCSTIICSHSRCAYHMYHASVYTRPMEGIPDAKLYRWHSFVAKR